jgi:tetratricopeptide (TPR) repeat protein
MSYPLSLYQHENFLVFQKEDRMKRGKHVIVFCVIGIICLAFSGCATMDLLKADVKMQTGDHQGAITILKAYLKNEPDSVYARTQLGKAYLNIEELDLAIDSLLKVQQIQPKEPRSTLFLGLAYIGKEQYEKAIATWEGYKSYNAIVTAEIKKQLTLLKITYSRKMAQRALIEEKKLATIKPQKNTFAVCYYADASPNNSFRAFQKALAAMVISDLAKIDLISIVERIKLQSLFFEMGLGQLGIVDPSTAPRVGHLIGAENLVVGTLSSGSIRADTSLASTSIGEVVGNAAITVKDDAFFNLPTEIAVNVAKLAGIKLTGDQLKLLGKDHTKSYEAVISYGNALIALDSDNWKNAREFFEKALAADPRWVLALEGYQSCPPDASPTISQLLALPPLALMNTFMAVVDDAMQKKTEEKQDGGDSGGGSH